VRIAYIGEKDTRNTTLGVDALLVALFLIVPAGKTPLVAGNRVLVGLNAALVVALDGRTKELVVLSKARSLLLPAKGQVGGRDDLDKVHEVVCLLGGLLLGIIERVDVVASPSSRAGVLVLLLHIRNDRVAQLRTEAQVVDLVGERVRVFVLEVVLEVVHVHVASGERLSRRNVEVSNDLVDANAALQTASLLSLLVEVLGVVFTLALLDALATTKRPRYRSVCVADLVASVTAAGLDRVGGSRCAVALSAVIGSEMLRLVLVPSKTLAMFTSLALSKTRHGRTHRSSAVVDRTVLPSISGLKRTLLMPCVTPICSSPDTSITSSVISSHGTRGNVMFKLISMRSPLPLSTTSSGRTITRL